MCEGVWVSSFMAPNSKRQALLAAGITHIVNCTGNTIPCKYPSDFAYLKLHLTDQNHQRLLPVLDEACSFIAGARACRGTVLVHCAGGHSRSGSVALAYIMQSCGLNYADALHCAQQGRPVIQPIPGFAAQLEVWHALGCAWTGGREAASLCEEHQAMLGELTLDASAEWLGRDCWVPTDPGVDRPVKKEQQSV